MKSSRLATANAVLFGLSAAGSAFGAMRDASEKVTSALRNAAMDVIFTGGQRPDRARRSKRQQINFGGTAGKQYPFSSTRQDRRTARTQVSVLGNNGHVTMQTLPSALRRSEVEVDMVLRGELKTGLVDQRVTAVAV